MLALPAAVSGNDCHALDASQPILDQIKGCIGPLFDFQAPKPPDPVFELTGLDQATADHILYEKDASGKSDLKKPKKFKGSVTIEKFS